MRKSIFLFLLFFSTGCLALMAQTVKGRVTATDGSGLPGVSISVKGTTKGTTTDVDGNYSVSAPANATLVFSFIGYISKEEQVGNKTTVNVSLSEDEAQLEAVVVTALGIGREERSLGYATTVVNNEALVKTASPNFATALYGKAPGVTINAQTGGATSGVAINIRGQSSITGNTQPLIILDGIPIRNGEARNNGYWGDQRIRGNGLLDLNPADIENISVLKGASAAALYGSEAVNGVLLVTTKSGAGKKGLGVDFSASYNVDKIAYLPRYQDVRGPGYMLNYTNGGQDDNGFITVNGQRALLNATVNFGPKFDGQPVLAWDGKVRPYSPSGGSYADLFESASSSNINLAISNSTDKSKVRFSFTRQDNGMISYNSKNTKNIANLNTTFNLSKKLKTDLMVNFVNQHTHNRPFKVDRMINNFTGMMNRFEAAQWYFDKFQTSLGYRFRVGTEQSLTPEENIRAGSGFKSDIADYVWNTRKNEYDEWSDRVIGSITQHWDIVEGLNLRGRIATDITSERAESKGYSDVPLAFGNSGGFSMNNNLYNSVYGDVLLSYRKPLNDDVTVAVMAGYSANKQLITYMNRNTDGGLSTENLFDINASVNMAQGGQGRNRHLRDAYMGTVNFDYKNFFFVEGTLRRDRTSTLAPGNNSFFYPSANASFVFTDALSLPVALSYGKLRASWGIVGNYPGTYEANVSYNQGSLGIQYQGGSPVLYTSIPGNFGNDLIRPEQKHEFEIGVDLKFFKNRFGLDLSYYNAQIRDQILPLSIPSTSGAGSILANIGTLRNQGIEAAINFSPVVSTSMDGFTWDVIFNLAKNVNKVEKLANNSPELLHADFDGNAAQLRSVVGQPMGDIYAHGVLKNEQGRQVVDPNGMHKLDGDNWIKVGNAMPKLVGGLINSFNYKRIGLDVVTDYRFGGHIMPTGIYWMTSRGLTQESLKYMDTESGGLSYYKDANGKGVQTTASAGPNGERVWHDGMLMEGVVYNAESKSYVENDNVISQATYYNATYNWGGPQYGNARYDLFVQKNSYVKLRELSLSYRLPSAWTSKIGTQNVTLSVFGRNLFFFYRTIKDIDAEQINAGTRWTDNVNNAGNNPSFRTFGGMIRASF